MRRQVFKRDHGVCAECGQDTVKLRHRLAGWQRWMAKAERKFPALPMGRPSEHGTAFEHWQLQERRARWCRDRQRKLIERLNQQGSTVSWHADHIVPVAMGGGECGLENMQTLCVRCHNQKTKAMPALLAEYRANRARQLFAVSDPIERARAMFGVPGA